MSEKRFKKFNPISFNSFEAADNFRSTLVEGKQYQNIYLNKDDEEKKWWVSADDERDIVQEKKKKALNILNRKPCKLLDMIVRDGNF